MGNWIGDGRAAATLLVLLIATVLALAIGWLGSFHALFETVTNVRLQVAVISLAPLVGFLFLRRWQLAAVAFLVAAIYWIPLAGYVTASPDPVTSGTEVTRVMQYNIFFKNEDFRAIVDHIEASDADVVAIHELLPHQWDGLEPLLDEYPYRIAEPLAEADGEPGGGMALLARAPLTRVAVDPSTSPIDRVTLAATIEIANEEVLVVGLHPHASRTDSVKVELRERQLAGVAALAGDVDMPAIVIADLNVTPTSPVYDDFLDDLGWRDPHRLVGWHSSWPTWGAPFGMPIDHVFVSNEIALHGYETGDGAGSDHRSVVATISLR